MKFCRNDLTEPTDPNLVSAGEVAFYPLKSPPLFWRGAGGEVIYSILHSLVFHNLDIVSPISPNLVHHLFVGFGAGWLAFRWLF